MLFLKKLVSSAVLFLLIFYPLDPLQAQISVSPIPEEGSYCPLKAPSHDQTAPEKNAALNPVVDSTEFLSQGLTLQPAEQEFIPEIYPQDSPRANDDFVTEVYETAGEGLHEIQAGMPVAYLAKRVTVEDLRKLRHLDSEVGLLVAGDLVVIYSTGDESFIRDIEPVKELTKSTLVSLSAHFHKSGLPSSVDLHDSGETQYVISWDSQKGDGVWGYAEGEVLDALSYEEFIREIQTLQSQNQNDSVEVRKLLNGYIQTIDQYREEQARQIGEPAFTQSILYADLEPTVLPDAPFVGIFETNPATQNNAFNQTSSRNVRFNYDVSPSGTFAALSIQFDNFGTPAIETADLSGFDEIVFGLASNNPSPGPFVEFEDQSGIKARFQPCCLTSETDFFAFTDAFFSSLYPAFNLGQVRFINFFYDQTNTSAATRTGFLDVTAAGLYFIPPPIQGDDFNSNALTLLPAQPVLSGFGANAESPSKPPGVITLAQTGPEDFSFIYNVKNAKAAYVVASISKGSFDGTGIFQGVPIALPSALLLALQGDPAVGVPDKVKVKVVDTSHREATYDLLVTSTLQNFSLDLEDPDRFPPGFDRNQVAAIEIVVDQALAGSGNFKGKIWVKTKGLKYIPVLPGTSFDANALHMFSEEPVVTGVGANAEDPLKSPGIITLTQINPRRVEFVYNVKNAKAAFVVASINKGYFDENNAFQGVPLSLPSNFTFALQGGVTVGIPNKVRVRVVDTARRVAEYDLSITNQMRNYALDLTDPAVIQAGFDRTNVAAIEIVIDQKLVGAGDRKGKMIIRADGLDFLPILNGSAYNESLLSALSNQPVLNAGGGNNNSGEPLGNIGLNPLSANEFEYEYDLTPSPTSFVYARISKGYFDSNGHFQGAALNLPENFILSVKGREGSKIKVEVKDIYGKAAEFILNLLPIYQNFLLELSAYKTPTGFDRTKIAEVVFVEDQDLAGPVLQGLVKIKTKGLHFVPPVLPAPFQEIKTNLIQKGLDYFQVGVGVDPGTHFPYDNIKPDGTPSQFTQPTLIGFYLQMLADVANGKTNGPGGSMTASEALLEANNVLTTLLSVQQSFGWNGLLPFLNLNPTGGMTPIIGFGDNANMAQSLAVFLGALEGGSFNPAEVDPALVADLMAKANQALENMAPGLYAFYDPSNHIFRSTYNRVTQTLSGFMDRLANEFRGAVAFVTVFLKVRYPALPNDVWNNLAIVFKDYTDRNGEIIENLAYWDGGAFQAFWPLLRNNELDFLGFRNALVNHLATQADYAAQNRIPGFLSASQMPNDAYFGALGVPQVAENPSNHLIDLGSTYALASAMPVNPGVVLSWLNDIEDQIPALNGTYGFLDAARSNTEIAPRFIGIDIASTVLGLSGAGPEAFEIYLRNHALELAYNRLYESASQQLTMTRTSSEIASAPEFPDRSFAVFSHLESEGTVGSFPVTTTSVTGIRLHYTSLPTASEGHVWRFNQTYDASANQLVILYSVVDSPQSIKIELKDNAQPPNILFQTVKTVAGDGAKYQRLVVDLPNDASVLAQVKRVVITINQQGNPDIKGDFTIHAIDFQHLPASQNLIPASGLGANDVTLLPGNPTAQVMSENPGSGDTLVQPDPNTPVYRLNYNLSDTNQFSGIYINFATASNPQGVNLTGLGDITFGIKSDTVSKLKLEIEDMNGKKSVLYVTDIDITKRYYEFLQSLLPPGSADFTKVKRMNITADESLLEPENSQTGSFELELRQIQLLS